MDYIKKKKEKKKDKCNKVRTVCTVPMTKPINEVIIAPSLNSEIKALVVPSLPLDLQLRKKRKEK